jgi:hypothetical protein
MAKGGDKISSGLGGYMHIVGWYLVTMILKWKKTTLLMYVSTKMLEHWCGRMQDTILGGMLWVKVRVSLACQHCNMWKPLHYYFACLYQIVQQTDSEMSCHWWKRSESNYVSSARLEKESYMMPHVVNTIIWICKLNEKRHVLQRNAKCSRSWPPLMKNKKMQTRCTAPRPPIRGGDSLHVISILLVCIRCCPLATLCLVYQ